MARRKWTDANRQFLKENYQKMTNKKLAEHFNLTACGIGYHLKKLGLKRAGWTEEMDDFLRNNYTKMPNKEMADELGKTICAIDKRLGILKIRRTDGEMDS
ncbi:MAG: zinc-finger domain-containing protein [Chloroflexi bacterium]|nr:zinc-finger domain-containing protein [Chloroflexota bacterium]